ncbi:MAG: hypothetical protein LBQ66_05505 [Planctomycetaceae bacterium]|nr:hypothetical protein [Planctomycetaceae bacterium]
MWYNKGGTPAFQSVTLRGNCRLRRRVTVWNINTIPAPILSVASYRR